MDNERKVNKGLLGSLLKFFEGPNNFLIKQISKGSKTISNNLHLKALKSGPVKQIWIKPKVFNSCLSWFIILSLPKSYVLDQMLFDNVCCRVPKSDVLNYFANQILFDEQQIEVVFLKKDEDVTSTLDKNLLQYAEKIKKQALNFECVFSKIFDAFYESLTEKEDDEIAKYIQNNINEEGDNKVDLIRKFEEKIEGMGMNDVVDSLSSSNKYKSILSKIFMAILFGLFTEIGCTDLKNISGNELSQMPDKQEEGKQVMAAYLLDMVIKGLRNSGVEEGLKRIIDYSISGLEQGGNRLIDYFVDHAAATTESVNGILERFFKVINEIKELEPVLNRVINNSVENCKNSVKEFESIANTVIKNAEKSSLRVLDHGVQSISSNLEEFGFTKKSTPGGGLGAIIGSYNYFSKNFRLRGIFNYYFLNNWAVAGGAIDFRLLDNMGDGKISLIGSLGLALDDENFPFLSKFFVKYFICDIISYEYYNSNISFNGVNLLIVPTIFSFQKFNFFVGVRLSDQIGVTLGVSYSCNKKLNILL